MRRIINNSTYIGQLTHDVDRRKKSLFKRYDIISEDNKQKNNLLRSITLSQGNLISFPSKTKSPIKYTNKATIKNDNLFISKPTINSKCTESLIDDTESKLHKQIVQGQESVMNMFQKVLISKSKFNETRNIVFTRERYSSKHISNERLINNFKNIDDSLSENDSEFDYFDYVPKWYSINQKSTFYKIWSFSSEIHLILMLIFYPLELVHFDVFNSLTIFAHVYLELVFLFNYLINIAIGYKPLKSKGIIYPIFASFIQRIKVKNIIYSIVEIFHIIYSYILTIFLWKIFNLSEVQFKSLLNSVIISKFIMIIYINHWININSIIQFSNNIALYFGMGKNINKEKKIKVSRKEKGSGNILKFILGLTSGFKIFLFYFIFIHIFTCVWIYISQVEIENLNGYTWRKSIMYDPEFGYLYVSSFYFCLTTLLSVGYGDIIPRTIGERLFVSFFMIVCAFFYSFLITLISFLYSKNENKIASLLEKEECLKQINKEYFLKEEFYLKVHNAILHYNKDNKADSMTLIENLPRLLKYEMQSIVFNKIIQNLKFFDKTENNAFIFETCNFMKGQIYEKKVILVTEGNIMEEIYFVLKGKIILILPEKFESYPISQVSYSESYGEHIIEQNKASTYTIKTGNSINEILTLSKDSYYKNKFYISLSF